MVVQTAGRKWLLWVVALVVMLAAGYWQRRVGPSYPFKGEVTVAGTSVAVRLPRNHTTASPQRVAIAAWDDEAAGTLWWRRFPTNDPFAAAPLVRTGDELAAELPLQPPAGKVEYYLELSAGDGTIRVPAAAADAVILRYKAPVPLGFLVPHIAVMFLSMLVGVRAGLAALFKTGETRTLTWIALGGLTVGGMILGPIAQKYAFGAFWTGVPFGWDLTDNKTLLMWLGWGAAGIAFAWRARAARATVVVAALVMLAVYLVPHSLRGSELDYAQLQGPVRSTSP